MLKARVTYRGGNISFLKMNRWLGDASTYLDLFAKGPPVELVLISTNHELVWRRGLFGHLTAHHECCFSGRTQLHNNAQSNNIGWRKLIV